MPRVVGRGAGGPWLRPTGCLPGERCSASGCAAGLLAAGGHSCHRFHKVCRDRSAYLGERRTVSAGITTYLGKAATRVPAVTSVAGPGRGGSSIGPKLHPRPSAAVLWWPRPISRGPMVAEDPEHDALCHYKTAADAPQEQVRQHQGPGQRRRPRRCSPVVAAPSTATTGDQQPGRHPYHSGADQRPEPRSPNLRAAEGAQADGGEEAAAAGGRGGHCSALGGDVTPEGVGGAHRGRLWPEDVAVGTPSEGGGGG